MSAVVTAAMPLAVRARRLRPLEQGHPLLEHVDGRIGIARIDIAGLVALHPGLGRFHVRVGKALGEKQGLGGFAELRADACRHGRAASPDARFS